MLALPGKVGAAGRLRSARPAVTLAVAALVAAIFVGDVLTPAGYTIWVLYIAAMGVSLSGGTPWLPLATGVACSVFTIVGFVSSPEMAADPTLIALNRGAGVVTLNVLGALGWRLVRTRLEVEHREWLQAGRAELQVATMGDPQLERLCLDSLSALCAFLGLPAGAFHVADGTGRFLRRAALGVPDGAAAATVHAVGEGLVGRAAAEGRLLRVGDLPRGYLPISSGLGAAPPVELVLVPLVDGDETIGVLELAFLHPAVEEELEFLAVVCELLAVELGATLARLRTQELLEETQRQSEEMQAQQEELEAANAELESHARALRESQDRLAAQNAELEQTTVRLEEQGLAVEKQRDALARAQAELEAKAEELERASRYKSEFLANMSHELRTPLNSSLILARLLADNRDGTLTAEQVKYAETIYAAGNDLLALINDVLDLSQIEAGKVDLRAEPIPVAQLLEAMQAAFEQTAAAKSLDFHVGGAPPGLVLHADRRRVEQVLRNLLSNAIKFTASGSVTLTVTHRSDRIRFSVEDSGIGIAQEAQEIIFEAFRQADGSTSRRFGGTGLGLAISRDLAGRMGGTLHVESTPGRGSTFSLELPLATAAERVPPLAAPARVERKPSASAPEHAPAPAPIPDDRDKVAPGARAVLIIEDDLAFAQLLVDLARELHFDALVAANATDGMELARRYAPAAVLLDLALPDHHGLSVLDRMKRDPALRHIPVHVISATDFATDALAMGAVGYERKPVKRERLVEAFRTISERLGGAPRRVLVVEDDPRQLDAICELLASAHVETERASGIAEALERLATERFECMVTDLRLTDGSGHELLERMAAEKERRMPPVIVYTGQELGQEEEERLRRYSDSIIIKGARSPERLLDEVTLFLHQVEARLPAELQRMLHAARNRDAFFEGRKILVAEDDIRNVFALSSILEPKGATVEIARDGLEALDALEKNEAIDLVLMDIMMPRMDGFEAIRRIRDTPRLAKVPIIALTAKAMPDDQARCLAVGANDYASKPIDVEKLLSLIRVWMPRRERS